MEYSLGLTLASLLLSKACQSNLIVEQLIKPIALDQGVYYA